MARCAKNHQFRAGPDPDPQPGVAGGQDDLGEDDRRADGDRRASGGAGPSHPYGGPERRQGPRRAAELPSSIWRQPLVLALAIGLGVASGLAINSFSRQPPAQQAQAVSDAGRAHSPAPMSVDAEALAGVQTLRDEAEALTTAQVELDETAHERWMPRVAMIERALEDPDTHPRLRDELSATIAALECVGVLGDPAVPTCATIRR